ncbi:hypothetical protein NDU88_003595 [Pleurodeles waltl]|uniref:Uncharacterized protein n=1 Tax=Pleurodeles waltl TaxID=8319 RepID=A0AAV7M5R8_PLEWA|nr:hypothetical protein NDU88_003595 [Pleurodeles waltl]
MPSGPQKVSQVSLRCLGLSPAAMAEDTGGPASESPGWLGVRGEEEGTDKAWHPASQGRGARRPGNPAHWARAAPAQPEKGRNTGWKGGLDSGGCAQEIGKVSSELSHLRADHQKLSDTVKTNEEELTSLRTQQRSHEAQITHLADKVQRLEYQGS